MSLTLWHLGPLQVLIEVLQYKESPLLLTMIGYKALSIEVVLNTRKGSSRTAKILENPRRGTAEKGYALQHGDLVLVETFLILLRPACLGVAMAAKERVSSKFAHDQRLIVFRGPFRSVEVCDGVAVPANIFIGAHDVELISHRIIDANREMVSVLYLVFL